MAPRPVGAEMIAERRVYLAPLLTYLREHHYTMGAVARQASIRGGFPIAACRLWQMKRGDSIIPPWFVAECCRVIGKSVRTVMGDEWVKRYGRTGRGGTHPAPVGSPRVQRPPKRPAHYQRRRATAVATSGVASGVASGEGQNGGAYHAA